MCCAMRQCGQCCALVAVTALSVAVFQATLACCTRFRASSETCGPGGMCVFNCSAVHSFERLCDNVVQLNEHAQRYGTRYATCFSLKCSLHKQSLRALVWFCSIALVWLFINVWFNLRKAPNSCSVLSHPSDTELLKKIAIFSVCIAIV